MNNARTTLILVMCLFGSIGIFVRNINLSSSQIALARGTIGSLVLLFATLTGKQHISWKAVKPNFLLLLLSGMAIGFNWLFLFEAYKYTSIANATLSYYFAPIFVMLLSAPLLKEGLNISKLLSITIAMLGMFLIVGSTHRAVQTEHLIGIGYGLLAAALYAAVILMNKFIKGLSGLETTLIQLAAASCVLFPYVNKTSGINLTALDGNSLALLLVVGIVHTGLAYLLYFSSLRKLPGQSIAVLSYIDPFSAILMSSLFLGERMSVVQAVGGFLILGATFLSEYDKIKYKLDQY